MKTIMSILFCVASLVSNAVSAENFEALNVLVSEHPYAKTFYNPILEEECTVFYKDENNTIPVNVISVIQDDLATFQEIIDYNGNGIITKRFSISDLEPYDRDLFTKANSDWYTFTSKSGMFTDIWYVIRLNKEPGAKDVVLCLVLSIEPEV